jgi:hypothetical protein
MFSNLTAIGTPIKIKNEMRKIISAGFSNPGIKKNNNATKLA